MSLSSTALEITVAIAALFIGLFFISLTAGIIPSSDKLDFAYTTGTNATSLTMNGTANATQTIVVSTIGSIAGKTANSYIGGTITSTDTSNHTATILFNGAVVDTVNVVNQTATSFSFDIPVSSVIVGKNNITASTGAATTNKVNLTSSLLYYPSSTASTSFGTYYSNLVTSTGTIFDVVILVIVITALAIGMAILKGFTGGTGGATETSM